MKDQNIVIEVQVPSKAQAARDAYEAVQDTKARIRGIQKLIREDMLKDPEYAQLKEQSLELGRELRFEKNKKMRQQHMLGYENQIKELKDGLKNKQLTLFAEVDKYTEETGQFILPLEDERKVIEKEYKFKKF